ncbi:glycosyltransferase [bacterium]|nr:glycosyltransferase [bacterium]
MPRYSLVIPIHDCERDLPAVLPGLAGLSSEWEIIVVDDRCRHNPEPLVKCLLPRAICVASTHRPGAAGARNCGASWARGRLLFFLDSDVVVTPQVLFEMAQALSAHSELAGVFGCYSQLAPADHSSLSRFRNLLHRYVHRRCAGLVASFWTGLGAVSKQVFVEVGGFDEGLSSSSSIEDVEFGARLSRAGHKVLLDPRFEGVHLKRWTLSSMVITDVFHRAAPWMRLILEGKIAPSTLNGGWRFRLGPLFMLATLWLGLSGSRWAGLVALLYTALQVPLHRALTRDGGWRVGLVAIPGLVVHHFCCCLGAALAVVRPLTSRRANALRLEPLECPGPAPVLVASQIA